MVYKDDNEVQPGGEADDNIVEPDEIVMPFFVHPFFTDFLFCAFYSSNHLLHILVFVLSNQDVDSQDVPERDDEDIVNQEIEIEDRFLELVNAFEDGGLPFDHNGDAHPDNVSLFLCFVFFLHKTSFIFC